MKKQEVGRFHVQERRRGGPSRGRAGTDVGLLETMKGNLENVYYTEPVCMYG